MGAGKSYTGKNIAGELNVPFIDLDHWMEDKYGCSVTEIFANEGEAGFRQKESLALAEIYQHFEESNAKTSKDSSIQLIISTGGGAPCFNGNMEWMNRYGMTVWLDPPLETLLQRLEKEKSHRPLLANLTFAEMETFIIQKLKERSVYYGKASIRIQEEKIDLNQLLKYIKHAQDI